MRPSRTRSLWVKFLFAVVPIFLVLSVPGLSLLVEHELHDEHDGLATRIGSASARAGLLISRYDGLNNGRLARDVMASLATDRAFLCAELWKKGADKAYAVMPTRLGCSGHPDAAQISLPVGDRAEARLLVKFSDAELVAARQQRKSLTQLVVGVSFLFAVITAAIGFRVIVGRPLKQLLGAIQNAAEDGQPSNLNTTRKDEFGVVMRSFNEMTKRDASRKADLETANTALRASQAELEDLNKDLDRRIQIRTAELQDREEALEESQRRFQQFAEASSDWFWEMDEQLRFCYFSDRFTDITGVTHEMLLGKTREETGIPDVDPDDWEEHLAKLHAHRPFRNFVHSRTKSDGSTVWLSISGMPIYDDDGNFTGYCGSGSDITQRKEIEEALAESRTALVARVQQLETTKAALEERTASLAALAVDLEAARDEAKAADRAKSQFLASMSHEFRTPLNAIIGFSEIIKQELFGPHSNEKYRDYAEDVNDSGQHLLSLINDLLDLSKIEAGSAELFEEDVDIALVTDASVKLVESMANNVGVELIVDAPQDLPDLRADQRKLIQVLVNLLSNAVKFTKSGGTVTLSAQWSYEKGLTLRVVDTGIGMAPEDIPKAMKQFTQVDGHQDSQYEGTGLGLPLTKGLIELHGGTFELESEVGVGTTATAWFPPDRIVSASHRVA